MNRRIVERGRLAVKKGFKTLLCLLFFCGIAIAAAMRLLSPGGAAPVAAPLPCVFAPLAAGLLCAAGYLFAKPHIQKNE